MHLDNVSNNSTQICFFQANQKSETKDILCAGVPMKKVRKCCCMADK